MAVSATERSLAARANGMRRWLHVDDRRAATAPALEGRLRKFEAEVDPTGRLDPDERRRRAELARHAFMVDMSRLAAAARRKKREALATTASRAVPHDKTSAQS